MTDGISFSSKVDLSLLVTLSLGVAVCVLIGFKVLPVAGLHAIWITPLLVVGAGLPLWIMISTRYLMLDDELRVRCGPWRWSIPIGEITAVKRASNPLASPALSMDRLQIVYGEDLSVLISPEPRADFLRQLEARRS